MASSSPNNSSNPNSFPSTANFSNGPDPNSIPNTTFIQADPTTFRSIVQSLTSGKPSSGDPSRRRPAFKLHERRPTARKLEIKLNNNNGGAATSTATALHSLISPARKHRREKTAVASPVSTLEYVAARGSPRTPKEEEDRAIAEKGFYLHPSPLSTPRGSDPPELLPLFPLHSPTHN